MVYSGLYIVILGIDLRCGDCLKYLPIEENALPWLKHIYE